jgi:hypothetical protein
MALLGFSVWLGLLLAAGLLFPRRPILSGFVFLGVGGVWFVIGIRQIRLHSQS